MTLIWVKHTLVWLCPAVCVIFFSFFLFFFTSQPAEQAASLLLQNPVRDALTYTAHKYLRILDYAHGTCTPTTKHSSCSRQAAFQRLQPARLKTGACRGALVIDVLNGDLSPLTSQRCFFLSSLQLVCTKPLCRPRTSQHDMTTVMPGTWHAHKGMFFHLLKSVISHYYYTQRHLTFIGR